MKHYVKFAPDSEDRMPFSFVSKAASKSGPTAKLNSSAQDFQEVVELFRAIFVFIKLDSFRLLSFAIYNTKRQSFFPFWVRRLVSSSKEGIDKEKETNNLKQFECIFNRWIFDVQQAGSQEKNVAEIVTHFFYKLFLRIDFT